MRFQSHGEIRLTKSNVQICRLLHSQLLEEEDLERRAVLTEEEGALLSLHEQLMNVPEEPLPQMYTAPPCCS